MDGGFDGVGAVLGDLLDHTFHAAHVTSSAFVAIHVGAQAGYFQDAILGRVLDFQGTTALRIFADRAAGRKVKDMSFLGALAPILVGLRL